MTPFFAVIDPWIFTFSAVTVFVTIFMGFWSARKSRTASDFFVAGRSVSVGWNASAISGEYLSAASFMGIAGMVMSSGYDALWYPVCYACGYLFLLLFIAGPLRRFGAYTIPDFAEGRFDSPLFRKIAVCFVLFIGFFYTMPQMKGAGVTLAYIFPGLPYWVGVLLVGAVITLNVALGGMKGITLVQAFQYWAKMFAISVPIFVLMAVYGHYGSQLSAVGPEALKAVPPVNVPVHRPLTEEEAKHNEAVTKAAEWRVFELRKPLPEKAPADSVWLSPFGPLTTKAAKAAKFPAPEDEVVARLTSAGYEKKVYPKLGVDPSVEMEKRIREFAKKKNPNDTKLKYGLSGSNAPAAELVSYFAAHYLWKEREVKTFVAPDVTKQTVSYPFEVSFEPAMFEKGLAEIFRANGLRLEVLSGGSLVVAGRSNQPSLTTTGLSTDSVRSYSLLYTYSLIIALVCGTAGLPHILVRFYTNPDGVAAKRTTMWVMILIGVFYVFPPVFGVIGRNLMPDLYNGLSGVKGTDGIVLKLPTILREKYGALGSILSGVTCAGAFAAFMSTFSGLLVSMTGALAHDVYGRILKPKSTSEQRLAAFKVCAVLIGGIAIVLGCFVEPLEINFMVGQAFAIAAASYFPLLFMSVWWRGMTMRGAATGMLTGGLCALIAVTLTNVSNLALDKGPMGKVFARFAPMNDYWSHHPLFRILCEQPAIWTVPLAIGLMIVVSRMTNRSVPSDVRMKMLVLHAPENLGLKQEYIQEHQHGH
jgi:Na+(H+)/acetate symporter ActP